MLLVSDDLFISQLTSILENKQKETPIAQLEPLMQSLQNASQNVSSSGQAQLLQQPSPGGQTHLLQQASSSSHGQAQRVPQPHTLPLVQPPTPPVVHPVVQPQPQASPVVQPQAPSAGQPTLASLLTGG